MTTFIGSAPVEGQIRSLASFLEGAQLRRENAKRDEANNQEQSDQVPKQDNTKATQSQFSLKIDELTTKKDSEKALLEILREPLTESLIRESSEKDIESFFLVTFSIIRRLTGSRQEVVNQVLSVLSTTSPLTTKAPLRLSLINVFYNSLLPSPINPVSTNPPKNKGKGKKKNPPQPQVDYFASNFNERLGALRTLITYAFQTNQSQVITPLIPQILAWVKSWHTSNSTAVPLRDLQSLSSLLLSNIPVDHSLSFTIRLQHLNSFTAANSDYSDVLSTDSSIKQTVTELIKEIINNEERILEIEELKEAPIVQHLAKQLGNEGLSQTLTMLSSGTLKDIEGDAVKRFAADNQIDQSKMKHKIKLLELTRVGQAGKEVSYEEVRDRLGLGSAEGWEDEVESWVVDAISVGVIEARLDQLRKVVIVDRVAQREFGKEQWEQIGSKLSTWKKTVGDLMAMIESRRTAAAST